MELGALILFTNRLAETVAFYRALCLPLEEEDHEGGPVHFACELGPVHLAVFAAAEGKAPPHRTSGGTMPGFAVPSIDSTFAAVEALGSKVVQPPEEFPWGPRFLVEDPDGRTVEVFQRKQ